MGALRKGRVFVPVNPLWRALTQFTEHYHAERNHQGKDNLLLFPSHDDGRTRRGRTVACRERLGGLLKYYRRTA